MIKFFNYPACDHTISVEKGGDAEEGQCVPDKGQRVAAGSPIIVCAQVESCGNYSEKLICKSCSQKCTAKFYRIIVVPNYYSNDRNN